MVSIEGATEGTRILNKHVEVLTQLADKARLEHGSTPFDIVLVAIEKNSPMWKPLVEDKIKVPETEYGYEASSYCGVMGREILDIMIQCAPELPGLLIDGSEVWGYTVLLMGERGISVSYLPVTEADA